MGGILKLFCMSLRWYLTRHTLSHGHFSDISSPQPQTADRDHSQGERESGSGTANQSRVNSPAGQWEPGGEDVSLMLNPSPPIESCLEGQGGGVTGRGEGGEGAEKDLISSRRDNSC